MPKFFRKENSWRVRDIKKPEGNKEEISFDRVNLFKNKKPVGGRGDIHSEDGGLYKNRKAKLRPARLNSGIIFAVTAFSLIGISLIFFSLYSFRNRVVSSLETELGNFKDQTLNFNPLSGHNQKLGEGNNLELNQPLEDIGVKIWPLFKDSVSAYKSFQKLTSQTGLLFQKIIALLSDLPDFIFHKKGNELIKKLEDVSQTLDNVAENNKALISAAGRLKDFSITDLEFYLPFANDLGQYQKFLHILLAWLKSPNERHLFVMLQNPSEMRPAGGFLGSYVDLSLSGGSIKDVIVHDINDLDRELNLKVIPPQAIQAIASRWRAADANWFFDFPSSAGKVIQLAEASSLYNQKQITFDGAIAVSAKVIEDLLALVGPLELKDQEVTITQDNFLSEIQKEIQNSRNQKVSYPKKILQDLAPALFEKLSFLDNSKKTKLFDLLGNWFINKDLMLYFKDPEFEKFFDSLNLSGQIYALPQNFSGDYLAVVNSNLGGGKTDIFIDQKIVLSSQLNDDGTVTHHLVVGRKHNGSQSKYSWYKVTNQNYLQIFTPQGSRLDNFTGGIEKKITPPLNYARAGYITDPLVVEIESTRKDFLNYPSISSFEGFGRNIFATWSKTSVGQKTELVFDYTHRLPVPLIPGGTYQFIFEKQAGTTGDYKFEISAPIGFVWEENNLPIFEYQSSDPPGRLILNLTLKKSE